MRADMGLGRCPCEDCPYGPSSLCRRGIWRGQDSGGCVAWTEWFQGEWPRITAGVRGQLERIRNGKES